MTELRTLYNTCSALNEAEYLPESWEAMDAALAKAGEMLEAGTAAPAEVKRRYRR